MKNVNGICIFSQQQAVFQLIFQPWYLISLIGIQYMKLGEYVVGGAHAVGLRDTCQGQTGGMSPPCLVFKMINALLLIIPWQAT